MRAITAALTIRARRWSVGAEFFGGKFAVAVLVERLEGCRSTFEFGGGNRSVVIGIKRRDHRRDGRFTRGWIFWNPFPIGRRWQVKFRDGDFAITISIEFSEHICGGLDLGGGQLPVVIRIKDGDQGRDGWWPPVPPGWGWLGRGGDARSEGQHPLQS